MMKLLHDGVLLMTFHFKYLVLLMLGSFCRHVSIELFFVIDFLRGSNLNQNRYLIIFAPIFEKIGSLMERKYIISFQVFPLLLEYLSQISQDNFVSISTLSVPIIYFSVYFLFISLEHKVKTPKYFRMNHQFLIRAYGGIFWSVLIVFNLPTQFAWKIIRVAFI